jgi:hypothetical protein
MFPPASNQDCGSFYMQKGDCKQAGQWEGKKLYLTDILKGGIYFFGQLIENKRPDQ